MVGSGRRRQARWYRASRPAAKADRAGAARKQAAGSSPACAANRRGQGWKSGQNRRRRETGRQTAAKAPADGAKPPQSRKPKGKTGCASITASGSGRANISYACSGQPAAPESGSVQRLLGPSKAQGPPSGALLESGPGRGVTGGAGIAPGARLKMVRGRHPRYRRRDAGYTGARRYRRANLWREADLLRWWRKKPRYLIRWDGVAQSAQPGRLSAQCRCGRGGRGVVPRTSQ